MTARPLSTVLHVIDLTCVVLAGVHGVTSILTIVLYLERVSPFCFHQNYYHLTQSDRLEPSRDSATPAFPQAVTSAYSILLLPDLGS